MNNISNKSFIDLVSKLVKTIIILVFIILVLLLLLLFNNDIEKYIANAPKRKAEKIAEKVAADSLMIVFAKEAEIQKEYNTFWQAKSLSDAADSSTQQQVKYGQELIAHTAKYFGPKGSVMQTTNGMNCQNCHLDAGTKPMGNNYGSVFSTYPKYRARSGKEEDIYKRVNDCFERSLNGKALEIESKEMQAIKAYIEFIGKNVPKGEKSKGSGIFDLPFLDRAADPKKGQELFAAKCISCHQSDGKGVLATDKIEYTYPPLWSNNSYNQGAGLYRLSRFAGYIKYNMPQGASFLNPQLSDEEAWDIAAFVNSQPRPKKDLSKDWPKIEEKVFDYPFGPYTDSFSETQHKYGPYKPIREELRKQKDHKEKPKAKK